MYRIVLFFSVILICCFVLAPLPCRAQSPVLSISGGPSLVLVDERAARIGSGVRAVFRIATDAPPERARLAMVVEAHVNILTYPEKRGYATLPPSDTTTKLFSGGSYGLFGLGGGFRLRLVTLKQQAVSVQLTGGLKFQSESTQQGDLLESTSGTYLFPTIQIDLSRSLFVSVGSVITSLDPPANALFPVQFGFQLF